ncbi:MAG: hypothetical protein C4575_01715 [Desulforudis sp.]|jgi:hypothetical protein|nr:MAG: hypothetical protein C4575_01715 [Desulforudis sp.]
MPSCKVFSFSDVPQNLRDKACRCAEELFSRSGCPDGNVTLILFPCDKAGATVAHRNERAVPKEVRSLTGARYVVFVPTALLNWEPELVEATLAHELGHIALGHCDKRMYWFLTPFLRRFGFTRLLLLHKELEADRYAARLGYAESLREVLRCLLRQKWNLPGAIRLWLLRRG